MNLHYLRPHALQRAIAEAWPLLLPAGCIEYHGPHLALGLDTILVEELLQRVAQRIDCIVAPPFWYGPTGYAVSGPDQGTVDVSTERFGRHVKDVLSSFWDMGFRWIIVCIHHQQMDGPEALAIRQAAAEVMFEKTLAERGPAWWGRAPLPPSDNVFRPHSGLAVCVARSSRDRAFRWPIMPASSRPLCCSAARPDLVEMDRLATHAPWYSPARQPGPQGHHRSRPGDVGGDDGCLGR